VKYEQGYTGATHMTKVFVKGIILFLQCARMHEAKFLISPGVCKIVHRESRKGIK